MSDEDKYYYYTPIKININYNIFKQYILKMKSNTITEDIASIMSDIEENIIASNAFKLQENKPIIVHNKWQSLIVKKTSLTSICMIFNKLNNDNIQELALESKNYNIFLIDELKQLADLFLGKCIIEKKKIHSLVEYFKKIMEYKLWYIHYDNKIISFRDTVFDKLESEYEKLIKIAGHIEDIYKNKIKDASLDPSLYDNSGVENYLKKKNIIFNLINLIGTFFVDKIISIQLIKNIFNQLKNYYNGSSIKKIYLELWLILWESVSFILNENVNDYYKQEYDWLLLQKQDLTSKLTNNINIDSDMLRIISLIDNNINCISTLDDTLVTFYSLEDEIKNLNSSSDYKKFTIKYNDEVIKKYIIKHLLNLNEDTLKEGISKINKLTTTIYNESKDHISQNDMNSRKCSNRGNLIQIIKELLDDDDIICDYPLFKKMMDKHLRDNEIIIK